MYPLFYVEFLKIIEDKKKKIAYFHSKLFQKQHYPKRQNNDVLRNVVCYHTCKIRTMNHLVKK